MTAAESFVFAIDLLLSTATITIGRSTSRVITLSIGPSKRKDKKLISKKRAPVTV